MTRKYPAHQEELDKNVTLGTLLEYTDEFLIPKMGEMMDDKIGALEGRMDQKVGKLRSDLIGHVDRRIEQAKLEIIAAINKRHEQYRMAFEKIMAILQRSNLAAVDEVKAVYELIA